MEDRAKTLVYGALGIALVALATMSIQIPVPQTRGYINLGDTVIFVFAMLFGARIGALAGGVGSALADLLTGYAHWAPFTLVIKGIEGLLVGLLASGEKSYPVRVLVGLLGGPCHGFWVFPHRSCPLWIRGSPGRTSRELHPGRECGGDRPPCCLSSPENCEGHNPPNLRRVSPGPPLQFLERPQGGGAQGKEWLLCLSPQSEGCTRARSRIS